MQKRRILLAVFAILMLAAALPAQAQRAQYRISAGTNGAIGTEEHQSVEYFGRRLAEESNGRFHVDCFSMEIGDAMSQIESVMGGTQEIYIGDLTWFANLNKNLNITGLAFQFKDQEHLLRFLDSEVGQKIWEDIRTQHGVRVLDYRGLRAPRVTMSKRPLNTLADLQGLKMRVPEIPIYMRVWDYIGTATHRVTWGEMYLGLAGGLLEAHEGPLDGILAIRTYEQAPYLHRTDHIYATEVIIINEDFFQSLPADLQEVVVKVAKETGAYYQEIVQTNMEKAMAIMESEGAKIIWNEDLREELRQKLAPLGPQLEQEGYWDPGLCDYVNQLAGE
ncbi:MAG: TRAP transporter substrate-binding protein [Firmicutes bacterium]|jgi:TRAP-type C4-dicarboxylate transport system substrate-binding protein|nr:TRAP transporter substrate-binding protein [Bacillota bacterium]